MDSVERSSQQLHEVLHDCFEQIRFARAAELARSGRYLEAEGLLLPDGREPAGLRELDLLARISAQQGMYGRARRLWEAALLYSPGNADYERAIKRTREAEEFQAVWRKGAMIALLILAIASVVVVWTLRARRSSKATALPSMHSAPQSVQPTRGTPHLAHLTPQPLSAIPQPTPTWPSATPQAASPIATPQLTAPEPVQSPAEVPEL